MNKNLLILVVLTIATSGVFAKPSGKQRGGPGEPPQNREPRPGPSRGDQPPQDSELASENQEGTELLQSQIEPIGDQGESPQQGRRTQSRDDRSRSDRGPRPDRSEDSERQRPDGEMPPPEQSRVAGSRADGEMSPPGQSRVAESRPDERRPRPDDGEKPERQRPDARRPQPEQSNFRGSKPAFNGGNKEDRPRPRHHRPNCSSSAECQMCTENPFASFACVNDRCEVIFPDCLENDTCANENATCREIEEMKKCVPDKHRKPPHHDMGCENDDECGCSNPDFSFTRVCHQRNHSRPEDMSTEENDDQPRRDNEGRSRPSGENADRPKPNREDRPRPSGMCRVQCKADVAESEQCPAGEKCGDDNLCERPRHHGPPHRPRPKSSSDDDDDDTQSPEDTDGPLLAQ